MEDADEDEEEEEEEGVINIDACDEMNPLAVVEYINDIYDFFKKSEVSLLFFIIIRLQSILSLCLIGSYDCAGA